MGQINLPLLNRTGYSVFWQSCFDDKLNYRKVMHSSILSKNIVKFFFRDKLSRNFFFFKKKKIFNMFKYNNEHLYELSNIKFKKIFNNIELLSLYNHKYKFLREVKSIPSYNTKLYFIKYNN